MDKYKVKDLKERLAKETSQEHKNKMLYMWVKQDHISLQEYNSLVINHSDLSNVSDLLFRYIGIVIAAEGIDYIPAGEECQRSDSPKLNDKEIEYLGGMAEKYYNR